QSSPGVLLGARRRCPPAQASNRVGRPRAGLDPRHQYASVGGFTVREPADRVRSGDGSGRTPLGTLSSLLRVTAPHASSGRYTCATTSTAFRPPKAKELDTAASIRRGRATLGT